MRRRRGSPKLNFAAWLKWLPLLVLPFFVLFFEIWLQAQILANDYETNEIIRQLGELSDKRDALRAKVAELRRMERIDSAATALGLVEPEPNQIVIVRAAPSSGEDPEALPVPDRPALDGALARRVGGG